MGDRSVQKLASDISSKSSECVRVVVRVRPMSSGELDDGHKKCVFVDTDRGEISIKNPKADDKEPPKVFTFDRTYGDNSKQKEIYDLTAAPIVESCLNGYNGTIFAYGQTGAGKTFTMEGSPDSPETRGIIPNSFMQIFNQINSTSSKTQFLVRVSYLEIYNDNIRDLLAKDPTNRLELKESVDSGVYVKDLTNFVVRSVAEIDQVMKAGNKNRSKGATKMNISSSRSHSIFTVTIESSQILDDGDAHIRVGKLNMVDLAGSERQSKTGATGDRLIEATKINLSLSALGNVISALVDGKSSYIPYRDSKLTRLLQDSLGGNTKTVMIANCGPAAYNYDETISTLRYASRAKKIKNKPKINEDPKDAMLREFQEEIERLRKQLEEAKQQGVAAGTMMVDGKEVPIPSAQPQVKEVVVEKVEVKDISEEKIKELEEKAKRERESLLQQKESEMQSLLSRAAKTEEDKRKMEHELETKSKAQQEASQKAQALQDQIAQMQQKIMTGKEIYDKAVKQEAELRQAQIEIEERKRQEATLARELEEANVFMEEQYASMAEEVEVKTKKLKKVWNRYQAAKAEIRDLQEEFQQEKEDMLETVRLQDRELRLCKLIIENFVPLDIQKKIESLARYDEETNAWSIPHEELAGNKIRALRPASATNSVRPITDYSLQRQHLDSNPRYKHSNVVDQELDQIERTTEDYDANPMNAREYMPDEGMAGQAQYRSAYPDDHRKSKKRPSTASRRRR